MKSIGREKLTQFMLKLVLIFAFVFLTILLVMQTNHSITFDETGKVIFVSQRVSSVVLRLAAIFFVLILSKRTRLVISQKIFYVIGMVYVLLNIALVFILSLWPTGDQYYMTWIASDMIRGGTPSLNLLDIWTCTRFSMAS